MEYDFPLRYLARVWVDARTTIRITEVAGQAEALAGASVIAETIHQVDLSDGTMRPRLQLHDENRAWMVDLPGVSIDVTHQPRAGAGTGITFPQFVSRAAAFIAQALPEEAAATRMAFVQEGLLPPMQPNELDRIVQKLIRLPRSFQRALPFEWDYRCVSRIERQFGARTEATNHLITVKRARVKRLDTGEMFDRIRVDLDVNTDQDRTDARFTKADVTSFGEYIPMWHAELVEELTELIEEAHAD